MIDLDEYIDALLNGAGAGADPLAPSAASTPRQSAPTPGAARQEAKVAASTPEKHLDIKQLVELLSGGDVWRKQPGDMGDFADFVSDETAKYTPPQFLISFSNGTGSLPRGDIAAIKAKSKNGKSFLASIFAAVILGGTFGELAPMASGSKVIYFDTEQNNPNVQRLQRRVLSMANLPTDTVSGCLKVFKLRRMDMRIRWAFIKTVIEAYRPDAVFIDGVADLIDDFNDIKMSNDIIGHLMQTATECNCAIVFVLHTNKSKEDNNMKGHLGTMAVQKCSDVFEVKRNAQTGVFDVTETESRNVAIPDFSFILDNNGMPQPSATAAMVANENRKNEKKEEIEQIMTEIFSDGRARSYQELADTYVGVYGQTDRNAKRKIKAAFDAGVIKVTFGKYYLSNDVVTNSDIL